MRFSPSTHLLMCLFLETLKPNHKDWLTYSGGTDRSDKLCYNFSSNDLTQRVNFPTQIPDCDSHIPFLSSYASICSTVAFPPLGNSDHVVVSGFIDFPSNSQQDAPFHCIAYVAAKRDSTSLVSTLLNQNLFQFAINE